MENVILKFKEQAENTQLGPSKSMIEKRQLKVYTIYRFLLSCDFDKSQLDKIMEDNNM